MIRRKQTLFSSGRTGVLSILIFTLLLVNNISSAQESAVKINDLRRLANSFEKEGQYFLAYLYNLSYYQLSADSAGKLDAGLDALHESLKTAHFEDGAYVLRLLLADFPGLSNPITYRYGYLLMRQGEYGKADTYIRRFAGVERLSGQVRFLRAYAKFRYYNHPEGSLNTLEQIEESTFPKKEKLKDLKATFRSAPPGAPKHLYFALPLSVVLPGAGQAYAGFHFDALNSFGFNLVLGYAAYASWRHELDLERRDRNYILPILSTAVWSVFYLGNIFNTINAVNKANLYRQSKHYQKILEKFQIILSDEKYFLNVGFNF